MKYVVNAAVSLALLGCAATKPISLYQTYTDYSGQMNSENVEQQKVALKAKHSRQFV